MSILQEHIRMKLFLSYHRTKYPRASRGCDFLFRFCVFSFSSAFRFLKYVTFFNQTRPFDGEWVEWYSRSGQYMAEQWPLYNFCVNGKSKKKYLKSNDITDALSRLQLLDDLPIILVPASTDLYTWYGCNLPLIPAISP